MIAKSIVESDAFLDMPTSARLLYYDLNMRADDDGFVNSPKKIMRETGASGDDLKILIGKNFVIPFESGIVVIKHWRIHNYIRSDRYKETVYKDEKSTLELDENKVYSSINEIESGMTGGLPDVIPRDLPDDIPMVDDRETQDRLGKDRLDKERNRDINISCGPDESEPRDSVPYEEVKKLFNNICVSLPELKMLTQSRKKKIKTRWRELKNIESFENLFRMVEQSNFLTGRTPTQWTASFDWLMENDRNYAKVLEGNYDNKHGGTKGPEGGIVW